MARHAFAQTVAAILLAVSTPTVVNRPGSVRRFHKHKSRIRAHATVDRNQFLYEHPGHPGSTLAKLRLVTIRLQHRPFNEEVGSVSV
jgi:hypothetical protein